MPYSNSQTPPSQSTSFLGDPQRWAPKPASFSGGFSWINKDASNVKSKSHIAKVRAHVRNKYRHWKPGDPPRPPKAPSETSRSGNPAPHVEPVSVRSPSSDASSVTSGFSKDPVLNDPSSVTSSQSPETAASTNSNSPEHLSSALIPKKHPGTPGRKFFDPVRGSMSVLETTSNPRKEYERTHEQPTSRLIPSRSADPAKLISDANVKPVQEQPAPASRSKHESIKLLREVRDYNAKQTALQNRSLLDSMGGLRDDPFLSFPIESRRSVFEAADYWVNSWAPAQTPRYIQAGSWKPTIDKVFSITTTDEGAFESQVALAQSYLSRNKGNGEGPSKEVLYHQTRAMLSLRKHLEAGSVSAGPLLSSLNLLIMSVVHADRKAYDFHRKGLERMILTPSTNSTNTLLHAVIRGYFATSAFYFRLLKFQTRSSPTILNKPTFPTTKPSITYPTHPFPPPLSTTISTLPPGFCELALELTLSLPLIFTLASITTWNSLIAPGGSTQGVAIWFSWDDCAAWLSLLESLDLPPASTPATELPLAYPLSLTLLLYSITAHNRFHATRIYVQLVRDALDAVRRFEPRSQAQAECRLWMAVVVVGCARDAGAGNGRVDSGGLLGGVAGGMVSGSEKRGEMGEKRGDVRRKQRGTMSWESGEVVLKRYFWYEHFRANWRKCWEVEIGV